MPVHKPVKSLKDLCVNFVVENLETANEWAGHFINEADPQRFLSSFELLRN